MTCTLCSMVDEDVNYESDTDRLELCKEHQLLVFHNLLRLMVS